jgi:hypothetical protein
MNDKQRFLNLTEVRSHVFVLFDSAHAHAIKLVIFMQ